MKKILVTMMAFLLTIAAQAQVETVDTAQFVAVYDRFHAAKKQINFQTQLKNRMINDKFFAHFFLL